MVQTLKSFLSEKLLQKMAGDKVFYRGETYYEEGAVKLVSHTMTSVEAEVEGSFPYFTTLSLKNNQLDATCTCPAMQDYGFCKHAVSVGLYLIHNAPATTQRARKKAKIHDPFLENYPNLARWAEDGVIEIGRSDYTASTIRVYDEGGCIYEGGTRHTTIHNMLIEADQKVKKWFDDNDY